MNRSLPTYFPKYFECKICDNSLLFDEWQFGQPKICEECKNDDDLKKILTEKK